MFIFIVLRANFTIFLFEQQLFTSGSSVKISAEFLQIKTQF